MRIERVPADVSRETFMAIASFLVEHARDLSPGPIEFTTATENLVLAIGQGTTLVAIADDDKVVGVLSLHEIPHAWTMDQSAHCLIDFCYFIHPAYRHGIRVQLEKAAVEIGEAKRLPVYISRRRRIG